MWDTEISEVDGQNALAQMSSESTIRSTETTWRPISGARHPALIAAGCLALGVILVDNTDVSPGLIAVLVLCFGLVGVALAAWRASIWRVVGSIAIGLALIALGSWRIAVENSGRPSESLRALTALGRRVEVFARVDGVPFQKTSGWRVPLNLVAVKGRSGDLPVQGRVLLTSIPSLQGLRYGDYVRFEGRAFAPMVQRNPGGFDYAEYLRRQGFDATIRPESPLTHWPQDNAWSLHNLIEPVRGWIRATFERHFDETGRSLLVGLLLGDTDRLPKPIYSAFRESGTSHLLAVSGANVWLVVGMILWPLYFFAAPRWPRTLIALTIIVLFSSLTRNEPSVVRASLMVGLILIGRLLWRPVAPLNAVGAAASIIMLFAPSHLFRPGFQLSFAAVIGILIAVNRVSPHLDGFWRKKWIYAVAMFAVASVSATIATAPISAWHFGTVPVAGIVSNLVMVPLAGLTAQLGLVVLALHMISATVAGWIAWLAGHLLGFSTQIAVFFANVPSAVLSWPSPSTPAVLHIAGAAILLLSWRQRYRWLRPLAYYCAAVMIVLATQSALSTSSPSARLSFLDTGRQRVAVISAPDQSPIGLIDDPGIDEDLAQWIIQPFLRHELGRSSLENWDSWRRLAGSAGASRDQIPDAPVWQRYYSSDDADSIGRPRVWADRWRWRGAEVLMFRDVPKIPLSAFPIGSPPPQTLILPAQAQAAWIRNAIDSVRPSRVLLYGRPRFSRSPDETLAFWRLRYPDTEFYSSGVHGGVSLSVQRDRVAVRPTVPESLSSAN